MLTQLAITAAKPKAKSYKISDGAGLSLLVEMSGGKLWRFRYHFAGKEKMLSFGSYPDVTLAQARTRRDEARKTLTAGVDPAQKRKEDKIAASISAANTFGVLTAEYIDKLEKEGAAASTVSKNKMAAPGLGRPACEASRR